LTSESEIIILLDNSVNLQKLKETILIKKPFKIISFDYATHKLLKENLIPHTPSDTFLKSSDFEKLQRLSHQFSNWALDDLISQELEYEGVNIGHLFYRDFQHSLLPILKTFYEIFKITESLKNHPYIVSSSLFQHVTIFSNRIEKFDDQKNNNQQLLNQSIKYQFNFANTEFSFKLSRKNYRSIKNLSEKIIHKFFGPKKNLLFTNVLMAEFDPIKYQQLFIDSKNSSVSLSLYNRRRPSIWNKKSYSIIKNSNSQILSPLILNTSILSENLKNTFQIFKKKIDDILNNEIFFNNYFLLDGISFWSIVKPILEEFFKQRLEENINEIQIAKGIFEKISFSSLLIQNESGFTEQILQNFALKKNIPILLISHGLSYETLNSQYAERRIFDGVDPIHSSKYLVWGRNQFMFAKDYGIDEKKLKIIGSPSHDLLFIKNQKNLKNDYVLLATSSPTASIIKDLTIDTLEKYENVIKDICEVVTKNGKNLIIKLHPFQEELDITNLVNSVNPNIKIIKTGDIVDLIENCSIFLTIDISTTILDAQIFSKPVISISVKNYDWGIPTIFESDSCIRTNMDSFKKIFSNMQTNTNLQEKMVNHGSKFIDDYLSFQGNSSLELLKFLQSSSDERNEEQVL
jgi:hypothetical protein